MARDELHALSRDRRLVTHELSPFNAFYGHASVLRSYAAGMGEGPVKAAIEHGISLAPNPGDPDLATRLPRYLCAAPAQARYFEANARHATRAAAIGPLVLYANALEPHDPDDVRRLVYFDAHSSHYATARYDVEAAAGRLDRLRGDFDEVMVCLYWRDVLSGRADAYARRGYRCTTAGHMFDDRFLFRLVRILRGATVVLTDQVGSHVLYAIALDRPVWLEDADVEYDVARDAPPGTLGPSRGDEVARRAAAVFSTRTERVEGEQRAYAEELAGLSSFRSPAEIAALLADAEEAYRRETPVGDRLRLQAVAAARRLRNSVAW